MKITPKQLIGCCLILFQALQLQGQSVTGTVVDALTREPLPGATILVPGQTSGTSTDSLGHFKLKTPAPVQVRVQFLGYTTWNGLLQSGPQNILMMPADNTLGSVVISATMKEVSKDQSPIPVEIYTPRFFQKNASANLFESLTSVNGVRPQLNCNICNTGDIHINGMEGPYTMVTIDGMPIVSGLSTVYGLSGIPNGLVERIEIVKGPASTLYGSEAVGGLINIITKNPLTAPRFFADVFGNSNGELNLDAALSRGWRQTHTLLGVNYFHFGQRLDINRDFFTDVALQDRFSVFNKWNFSPQNTYRGSLAWRYVQENRWGGEMDWAPQFRGTDQVYGESILTKRIEVLGKVLLPIPGRRAQLDASWNLHDQDSYYGTTAYKARQQVAFSQFSTDLPLGKQHDALFGAAFRYTWYDDNTPATADTSGLNNQPSKVWLPGVFVQDEIKLHPHHTLLLGLRYDYNSIHKHIFTPRLSWKWASDPQNILRLTAGSGYRVANIFTEDHAALSGAREVVILENLLPERSWNANLNFIKKFFPEKAGIIGVDASLFYTWFNNQILPDYSTNPQQIIYANLDGHGVSTGLSLNLDMQFLNGIKIIAGATWMEVYRKEGDQRLPQLFAPALAGTWTLSCPIGRRGFTLDYTGNLNGPMHLPTVPNDYRPATSPWFSIHNVQCTQTLGRNYELYFGIKNLFGFYPREDVILRAFDPFDQQTDLNNPQGYTFDPSYNYAPIQRQRLQLGIRVKIK
jgi:outer membrane receptor for ferrienterochelin and colicins